MKATSMIVSRQNVKQTISIVKALSLCAVAGAEAGYVAGGIEGAKTGAIAGALLGAGLLIYFARRDREPEDSPAELYYPFAV